jgi:hypothetical protein
VGAKRVPKLYLEGGDLAPFRCSRAIRRHQLNSGLERCTPRRCGSFQNLVLKGDAFGVVFLQPFFRGVRGGEGRTGAFPQE